MVAIIDNPIYEPDILIIESAATISALEFTKRKAIYEIKKGGTFMPPPSLINLFFFILQKTV